ncbi:MAG TPA: hypothetical protein VF911_14190, partial [Thermoanaerobaculia bacterium]
LPSLTAIMISGRTQNVHAMQVRRQACILALMTVFFGQPAIASDPHVRVSDAHGATAAAIEEVIFRDPASFDPLLESGELQWAVTFRCRPAYDRPEYQVSLVKHHDGRVEAFAIELTASSIATQLQKIRESTPGATPEETVQAISRREWVVGGRTNRDVSRLAREFERLSMRVQRPDGMFVDRTTYRLWSRTASQELSVLIAVSSSGENSDALIQWLQAVSRAVGITVARSATAEPRGTGDAAKLEHLISRYVAAESSAEYEGVFALLSERYRQELRSEYRVATGRDYKRFRESSEARWYGFSEVRRDARPDRRFEITLNATVEENGERETNEVRLTVICDRQCAIDAWDY